MKRRTIFYGFIIGTGIFISKVNNRILIPIDDESNTFRFILTEFPEREVVSKVKIQWCGKHGLPFEILNIHRKHWGMNLLKW